MTRAREPGRANEAKPVHVAYGKVCISGFLDIHGTDEAMSDSLYRHENEYMLHSVHTIDFELCADEARALAREAQQLRELTPKFNGASFWLGKSRFLAWRRHAGQLELPSPQVHIRSLVEEIPPLHLKIY